MMVNLAKPKAKNYCILLSPILLDINALLYDIISDKTYRSFTRRHATVSTCVVTGNMLVCLILQKMRQYQCSYTVTTKDL